MRAPRHPALARFHELVAQDEAGNPAARFVISDAWPVKYNISDLKGMGNEVLIEVLEIQHEGFERTA